MSLEQIRENYYRLERDYLKLKDERDALSQQVDRLEDGIKKHKKSVKSIDMPTDQCSAIDQNLWQLIETELGEIGNGK